MVIDRIVCAIIGFCMFALSGGCTSSGVNCKLSAEESALANYGELVAQAKAEEVALALLEKEKANELNGATLSWSTVRPGHIRANWYSGLPIFGTVLNAKVQTTEHFLFWDFHESDTYTFLIKDGRVAAAFEPIEVRRPSGPRGSTTTVTRMTRFDQD